MMFKRLWQALRLYRSWRRLTGSRREAWGAAYGWWTAQERKEKPQWKQ